MAYSKRDRLVKWLENTATKNSRKEDQIDRVDIPLMQRYSTHKWTLRARLHVVGRGNATSSIFTWQRRLPEQ